jgi:hypothetical protein
MTDRQHLMKALQDDAQRAGERGRLLLEARRARKARRSHPDPAGPARHLAGLLLRWTAAQDAGPPAPGSARTPQSSQVHPMGGASA